MTTFFKAVIFFSLNLISLRNIYYFYHIIIDYKIFINYFKIIYSHELQRSFGVDT